MQCYNPAIVSPSEVDLGAARRPSTRRLHPCGGAERRGRYTSGQSPLRRWQPPPTVIRRPGSPPGARIAFHSPETPPVPGSMEIWVKQGGAANFPARRVRRGLRTVGLAPVGFPYVWPKRIGHDFRRGLVVSRHGHRRDLCLDLIAAGVGIEPTNPCGRRVITPAAQANCASRPHLKIACVVI